MVHRNRRTFLSLSMSKFEWISGDAFESTTEFYLMKSGFNFERNKQSISPTKTILRSFDRITNERETQNLLYFFKSVPVSNSPQFSVLYATEKWWSHIWLELNNRKSKAKTIISTKSFKLFDQKQKISVSRQVLSSNRTEWTWSINIFTMKLLR